MIGEFSTNSFGIFGMSTFFDKIIGKVYPSGLMYFLQTYIPLKFQNRYLIFKKNLFF